MPQRQVKVSHRKVGQTLGQVIPAVNQLLQNESLAITKITALEAKATEAEAFREMSLKERLTWLLRGVK